MFLKFLFAVAVGGRFRLNPSRAIVRDPSRSRADPVIPTRWEAPVDCRTVCPAHIEAPSLTSKLVCTTVSDLPSQPPKLPEVRRFGVSWVLKPILRLRVDTEKCKQNLGLVTNMKLPSMTIFVLQVFVLSIQSNQTCLTTRERLFRMPKPLPRKSRRNKS